MGKTDLTNVLVSVFKISSTGSIKVAVKCMGHLTELQLSFPCPSLPLNYFDVQDLKSLLGIILFEIILTVLTVTVHYSFFPRLIFFFSNWFLSALDSIC